MQNNCSELIVVSYNELIENSDKFLQKIRQKKFPLEDNTLQKMALNWNKKPFLEEKANNSYPLLSKETLSLFKDFLEHKQKHGNKIEQAVYKDLSITDFITRLLKNRPLKFMDASDIYILQNGATGVGGFEKIGTTQEKAPLTLANYLSYDEIMLSALLSVAVDTYFINDGDRKNGEQKNNQPFEEQGIYVGIVGPRFEKENFMEWQHCIITSEQNTPEKGYGAGKDKVHNPVLTLWANYYKQGSGQQSYFPTYEEAIRAVKMYSDKFIPIRDGSIILNVDVFKQRMRHVIAPFLLDANQRAATEGQKAYIHAVGLGLGYWQIDKNLQAELMLAVYAEIIADYDLQNISDINFSYFPDNAKQCDSASHGQLLITEKNKIKIHFSKRNPAAKLTGEDEGKLLVAMYAWDGNAFPGNEYWDYHSLSASGDPAAACCSLISQLQNPIINPCINGRNTFIYGNEAKTLVAHSKPVTNFFQPPYTLRLSQFTAVHLEGVRKTIGANVSLLLRGGNSKDRARSGIDIAFVDFNESLTIILKNKSYAACLAVALKNYGLDTVKIADSDEGSKITLTSPQDIREFIVDICHLPIGYIKHCSNHFNVPNLLNDISVKALFKVNKSKDLARQLSERLASLLPTTDETKIIVKLSENSLQLNFSSYDYARRIQFVLRHTFGLHPIGELNKVSVSSYVLELDNLEEIAMLIKEVCVIHEDNQAVTKLKI